MKNNPLKILIVEDEISFQLDLEMIIDNLEDSIVAITGNAEEAIGLVHSLKPDLILLDININGKLSGIEVGKIIKDLNIPIIYTTSDECRETYQYVKENSRMFSYLIKPIKPLELEATLDLLKKQKNNTQEDTDKRLSIDDVILVKKCNKYFKIAISDIQYIVSEGIYSILHIDDQQYITSKKLKDLEGVLPEEVFMRTHRGCLMNINYLVSINLDDHTIKMKNNKNIPLSRSKKQLLLNSINLG